ncbi:hypothetical protein D3C73_1578160 [compost metagenome]
MLLQAPQRPQTCPLQRLLLIRARVLQRCELVEGEHDVRADLVLDPHGYFWRETMLGAIKVGFEPDAVLVYVGQAFLARRYRVIRA